MNNYQIIKELGSGAAGKVYLAKEKSTGDHFAIKEISIESNDVLKHTELEIDNMKRLNHPFIVRYHSSFQSRAHSSNSKLYIVMEYIDGGDLASLIKSKKKHGRRIPEDTILKIFIQIVVAIQYIHSQKVVHRDLKPQNIFMTKLDVVKIGDFGVSKQLNQTNSLCETKVGTPYYLSPEIWNNEPYGSKSDIWSLGCILQELCTLSKPFEATNINQLLVAIFTPGHLKPIGKSYSPELQDLVTSMLAQEPADRPSADDILNIPFIKEKICLLVAENEKKLRTVRRLSNQNSGKQSNHNISISGSKSDGRLPYHDNPIKQLSQLPRLQPILQAHNSLQQQRIQSNQFSSEVPFNSNNGNNQQPRTSSLSPTPPKKKKKRSLKKKKKPIDLISLSTELPLPDKSLPAWAMRAQRKVRSQGAVRVNFPSGGEDENYLSNDESEMVNPRIKLNRSRSKSSYKFESTDNEYDRKQSGKKMNSIGLKTINNAEDEEDADDDIQIEDIENDNENDVGIENDIEYEDEDENIEAEVYLDGDVEEDEDADDVEDTDIIDNDNEEEAENEDNEWEELRRSTNVLHSLTLRRGDSNPFVDFKRTI
ncbi:hypothetical protein M9Y10_009209 [Tritrichomonas musculus]|uniref:non-specific serine/threonine protein kinase n=1 Tax=Tritrichomonas musculus TaxID=1915356 RepID=A0ABR2INX6_9EUKA